MMMTIRTTMKNLCMLALVTSMVSSHAMAQDGDKCCIFMSDTSKIQSLVKGNKAPEALKASYNQLLDQAKDALNGPVYTVTAKGMTPPSGDKHDYMSIGVYWWPNPDKKDGLPWIRKDGQENLDTKTDKVDGKRFADFSRDVQVLALAGKLSGDKKYSDRAATLLRAWFITPETRMNPHLKYAQGVPGKEDGRPEGILDGRYMATRIVDSVLLLQGSASWSSEDNAAFTKWMESYLDWLTTSKLGKQEAKADNNHATWYNVQVAGIARFLGKDDLVKSTLNKTKKLVDSQIKGDGSQPKELARPRSFHYSYFNLQPMVMLAKLGTDANIDLWNYKNSKGGSIAKAVAYMAPYADPDKKWPHKNTDRESMILVPLLVTADNSMGKDTNRKLIENARFDRVPSKDTDAKIGNVRAAGIETWLLQLPRFVK